MHVVAPSNWPDYCEMLKSSWSGELAQKERESRELWRYSEESGRSGGDATPEQCQR